MLLIHLEHSNVKSLKIAIWLPRQPELLLSLVDSINRIFFPMFSGVVICSLLLN